MSEEEVGVLRQETAAARPLAAGAGRDVADYRAELRGHTRTLNALRETRLEQEQAIAGLGEKGRSADRYGRPPPRPARREPDGDRGTAQPDDRARRPAGVASLGVPMPAASTAVSVTKHLEPGRGGLAELGLSPDP
ncbi:hypothetical protein C6361_19410 [Plantactinospora sp. BC1]|nr:hypothetical protein C6361_19410 [Plantactinospora sp. BC1]